MDDFTRAYIEAALWSTTDESDDRGGAPLDENYSIDDIAPETINQMINDARGFQQEYGEIIALADDPKPGYDKWEIAGHDFWLTRNRHGAGFEDGHWGHFGGLLAKRARGFGEYDLIVGDDGLIYGSGGLPGLREPRGPRARSVRSPRRGQQEFAVIDRGRVISSITARSEQEAASTLARQRHNGYLPWSAHLKGSLPPGPMPTAVRKRLGAAEATRRRGLVPVRPGPSADDVDWRAWVDREKAKYDRKFGPGASNDVNWRAEVQKEKEILRRKLERERLRKEHGVRETTHTVSAPARTQVNDQDVVELVLFINNTSDLSIDGPSGQGRDILRNALSRWRKGTYDPARAVRLFEYLTESGAKRYAKEFAHARDWHTIFNAATRREAARRIEEQFREAAEAGDYD